MMDTRPWGTWEILSSEPQYKVKRITVKPESRLSYQKHARRAEHWIMVQGQAKVTLDGEITLLRAPEHIDIPLGAAHRIENPTTDETLVFIEVQTGDYFGEDDIVRLEDDYGRA